jgi:hypothetical protein
LGGGGMKVFLLLFLQKKKSLVLWLEAGGGLWRKRFWLTHCFADQFLGFRQERFFISLRPHRFPPNIQQDGDG